MKEQRNQKWQCHLWCILIAVLLSFSLLSFPVTALVPDTTGEDYEELTDPTLTEEFISSETIIGGETAELQADEIVTSSYLSDGVYAFRNIGNGNLWMDLERNNISSSAHIQQYYSETPPTESFSKAMLFKITRIGTTNRYVVRLMMNNLLTFDFDGTSVKTKRIPANDAEVDINDLICITYTASGYSLRPYDSSNYICANNTTASGLAGAPDSYLIASTLSVAGNCGRWEIHQYTGTARSGFSAGSSPNLNDGLTVGETSRVSVYAWSTTVGANHPSLEVTSAFSTRASVTAIDSATDFSTQFDVKALKAGRFEFCYRIKSASGTNVYSYYQMQMAIPDIDTGSFYIQNGTTGQYMDVEGPSTAEGAIIQQWTFSTATQKQWTIASAGSGYYTIKSNYSNKYVGVDSSDTTSVKQYSTVNDYTKWFFYETNSGRYSINNKALGVSYVLATPSDTSSTGINLTTAIYSNDTSYRDEWMLYSTTYRIVNYYDVSLINNTAYVQAIKQANEYVSSVLKSLFNVDLIMEGSA
ncbi:MAG: RICIN domain-containing protein, partial [Clostridia bacterium]|nr:RICIN domain-containing protein [Clostridia bacterium]